MIIIALKYWIKLQQVNINEQNIDIATNYNLQTDILMGLLLERCLGAFLPAPSLDIQIPLVRMDSGPSITFDSFQIQGKLGEGGFGVVFLGQLKSNIKKGITQKWAIKMVSKKKLRQHKIVQSAFNEKIIAMLEYKFIVSLIMSFQDQWYIYYVLQYASGGDTYSLIRKSSPKFPEFRDLGQAGVKFVAACVILGLEHVHRNGYIYRDLKPQNVMIFEDGYVKISDFGLAKKSVEGQSNRTILGTRFYYAPEMLLKKGYDRKMDLWELGVYLYELSNYDLPFKTQQITPQKFQMVCRQAQTNRYWSNPNLSKQLKDLIHNLLRFEPNLRIGSKSWSQIKQHAFFHQFPWNQLQDGNLKSPLKSIVDNHPTALKQYNPDLYDQRKSGQRPQIQGWSYYGKYVNNFN